MTGTLSSPRRFPDERSSWRPRPAVIFDTRDFLGDFPDSRWYLNGEEIAATRTPVKPIVDLTDFRADFVGDRA